MILFHEIFDKSHFTIGTIKIPKMKNWYFQRAVYRRITVLLTLAHIMHINKSKYLVFAELKNIGLIKSIFDKLCEKLKGPLFYGEWAEKLQTFR